MYKTIIYPSVTQVMDIFQLLSASIWCELHGSSMVLTPINHNATLQMIYGGNLYGAKYINSLSPSDAYMRRQTNHHCFR